MQPLPIDALLPEIPKVLREHPRLVLEAEAGAGKTTRVPIAVLESGIVSGQVWVAEPRRLAARLVAHRVASEHGEPVGERIGYTVRFEDKTSERTYLRYVTSGVLLRRIVGDPLLTGIGCVILDEFHERHQDTDLALALLLRAQERRSDLRLIVMSATLDRERICRHLGDCPLLYSEGRTYPLEIEFEKEADNRPLEKRVKSAIHELCRSDPQGSVLVFLPGAAEIRRCADQLLPLCGEAGFALATLHGDLPLAEQARAIEPGDRPRVVLTTNVAESSLTVQGITAVVDSGLVRRLENPASGIARLVLAKTSRASATQRAGRAGRISSGRVKRLFTRGDFESRAPFDVPEILRLDFCEALLLLHGADVSDVKSLSFLDEPAPAIIAGAQRTLLTLGAVHANGQLTAVGRDLLKLNIHPRLGRLALACSAQGAPTLGALAAALLSERELRVEHRARTHGTASPRKDVVGGDSDLLELVELFEWAEELDFAPRAVQDLGLDPRTLRVVDQAYRRLRQLLPTPKRSDNPPTAPSVLEQATLIAFADRVAKRRVAGKPEFVLRSGHLAKLADSSVVLEPTFIVALDVDERRTPGRPPETLIRLASAFHPDRLLDVAADELESEETYQWAEPPGRVEVRSRIRLGSLTIEESRRPARPGPETARFLLKLAEDRGLFRSTEITTLLLRLALLKQHGFIVEIEDSPEELVRHIAESHLQSTISLNGLDALSLLHAVSAAFPAPIPDRLRSDVPEQLLLPGGRRCAVHYEPDAGPWIESRLQDFFGMTKTPRILQGRLPLTVHLLAPNQRPVQITNDLEGFWTNHYPDLRRQLMRRYPKHSWPEDGRAATPPEPRPPRQRS